ncbi:hypothetical protein DL766_004710 [Monosporascus sp. MC13-8B]|uniref:Cytochrome P450 n=1 Tax=Monosporascus cannonballus TaxID=155416 RepID=A0ABY0H038_9PEZI|nr:hypothetical protein DL762_007103 [Monosporascus cannonballus]RYP01308.1 hypothetical protein DL763_000280 [Monosporascus cannonballus]RYP30762.1 hypothetical protein DL766_004710 [Monosporascus sp. MC13-8B]
MYGASMPSDLRSMANIITRFKTNKPFQVITDTVTKIFFPPEYAEELKDIKSLSFTRALAEELFTGYHGFEPVDAIANDNNIIQTVARLKITPSLSMLSVCLIDWNVQLILPRDHLTDEIADEASIALQEYLGIDADWQEATLKPIVRNLSARLSARVFVGAELCRDQTWLDISTGYAYQCFVAAYKLQAWPHILRWPVSCFLPECRLLRAMVADARRTLAPVIAKRSDPEGICPSGAKHQQPQGNTITWIDDALKKAGLSRKLAVADFQLGLSLAAIHTTTELLTNSLFDIIATGPKLIDELREEIIRVLGPSMFAPSQDNTGNTLFNKTRLYQLKLLDSTIKETQRIHTAGVGSMARIAKKDTRLRDGLVIPKGAFMLVMLTAHTDEEVFPEANTFNPRRFLELRSQPGQEKKWQLVTTSPHHLAFGYGDHACPGRFLAANEIKIALVYFLMNYDWKFTGKTPQDFRMVGSLSMADANAKVLFRRRDSELAL